MFLVDNAAPQSTFAKTTPMNLLVSVVLLNWNGDRHIHRCLEHVFAQTYTSLEVIVVDNASTDGSFDQIKRIYGSKCTYIENSKNLGYAIGMNQGIRVANGEFVIPLNQDVCLHEHFIEECVARIQPDNEIGAIGGRVYAWVGDNLTSELRKGEGEKSFLRKRFQVYAGQQVDEETWVFGPAGSFPFLRMKMLLDVQATSGDFYDESFVTGWEDTDLWFRMQLRGWRCLFLPSAYGWHVGSGSVGGKDTFFSKPLDYRTRILRNRLFTIAKNLPTPVLLGLSPYLIFTEIAMVPYFIVRSPTSVLAFLSAWLQFFGAARRVMLKREKIQQSAVLGSAHVKRFFVTL